MVFYFNVYFQYNVLFWCNAEFPAVINSSLQSSVSHDPSEINIMYWFAAQETFLIIVNVENRCAAQYFFQDSLMKTKIRTAFIWNGIFCSISVFTVTFDWFDASLLNYSITLRRNILLTPNFEQ